MRAFTPLILAMLMVMASPLSLTHQLNDVQDASLSPTNPTGVDLTVTDVAITYTNAVDEDKYRMFSSNHPIFNFNRPAELFVIDAMVNVSSTLSITVENLGSAQSGVIDVNVILIHNEYSYFEFSNTTVQLASLSGGASNDVSVSITPSYSGNHTLVTRATSTISDDVPSNDARSQTYTVGSTYFNCDSTAAWSMGSGWSTSTDTSISKGTSCHVGNGQFSSYTNNMVASMTTPIMDLSDAVSNPTRTNGLSFYYTGSAAANDKLTMYGKTTLGAWSEISSFTGSVSADLTSWNTFSINNLGAASPLIPVAQTLFHANSQFKFEFTSDATGTDIGYYIDDIVIMYDQKVRPNEYNVSAQGVATNGATPGEWGSVTLAIVNTGNITETFIPTLTGLPTGWDAYYTRPSGTSFDPSSGLMATPGASTEFNIMIKPDANASIGFQQMSVDIASESYPAVSTMLPVQFLVKADRIPVILQPSVRPSCPPSYTCTFEIEMTNDGGATDVFDMTIDTSSIPSDWSVGLSWTQSSSVLIRPGQTVKALFTMTVPENVGPDTVVSLNMRLQAQNDSSRFDEKQIDVSASMLSVASVDMVDHMKTDRMMVDAGDEITLVYQIWNNATRQDIFEMHVVVEGSETWTVVQPNRPNAVLNAGGSTTFEITVQVPQTAQADDRGPTITPVIESQRSFMVIEGEAFDALRVSTTHDIALETITSPSKLTPGVPNEWIMEVSNRGNGAAEVDIVPQEIPSTWDWWLAIDGENHTGPVVLSVSYDLEDVQTISLWVLLPMTEAAGELHAMSVEASHIGDGDDKHPEDNRIEMVASTGTVRHPSTEFISQSSSVMAGGMMHAEIALMNQGNAVEDRLSVTAEISSSPPVSGLIAFFTIDGGDRGVGSSVDLIVPAGSSQTLRIEVLVPDDAPLNTRFVLRFTIEGALDSEGLPYSMVEEAMILLDQQRAMDVDVAPVKASIAPHGTAFAVWINHTSTSTINEDYVLTGTGEEGWQITCDKRLLNETGEVYPLTAGHLIPQTKQHFCEVLRLSGPQSGQVMFTVSTMDGVLTKQTTIDMEFEKAPENDGMSSIVLATGGFGSIVFVGVLLFILRQRTSSEDDELFEELDQAHAPAGPPIQRTAGPPVSTHSIAANVPERISEGDGTTDEPLNQPSQSGPAVPETGLPAGWTEEQWAYYGQQYLDGTL